MNAAALRDLRHEFGAMRHAYSIGTLADHYSQIHFTVGLWCTSLLPHHAGRILAAARSAFDRLVPALLKDEWRRGRLASSGMMDGTEMMPLEGEKPDPLEEAWGRR